MVTKYHLCFEHGKKSSIIFFFIDTKVFNDKFNNSQKVECHMDFTGGIDCNNFRKWWKAQTNSFIAQIFGVTRFGEFEIPTTNINTLGSDFLRSTQISSWFWHLLSKCTKHGANFCVLLRKSELYICSLDNSMNICEAQRKFLQHFSSRKSYLFLKVRHLK